MGLLDEAIREHLELKRRRGGDPDEIAKAERDALGPARRGPEPLEVPAAGAQAAPQAEPEPVAEPVAEHELEPFEPLPDEPVAEEHGAVALSAYEVAEPEPEPATTVMPAPAPEPEEELAWESAETEPEPEPAEPAGQETVAFDPLADREPDPAPAAPVEPAAPDAPQPDPAAQEDEDVLEETPEFLQETPEHDRLWFEQRPPRDFDFDG